MNLRRCEYLCGWWMNVCLKPWASCTDASHALNFSGSPMVADRPLQGCQYNSAIYGL